MALAAEDAGSAGDSKEQREAEEWLINALSEKLGVKLAKMRWSLQGGTWIEVDGFCESPTILCEAWAHIGPPKSAQKNKVMTDAFKLLFVNGFLERDARRVLLFADNDAAAHFHGNSWMAQCLSKHRIAVEIIELPPQLKDNVLRAQQRQYR